MPSIKHSEVKLNYDINIVFAFLAVDCWGHDRRLVKLKNAHNRYTFTLNINTYFYNFPGFIAQLTKIYLGGRMLGFLPICGQFGENNELFVLTSSPPFFFSFSYF